ncbi:plasmid mobilization protein [Bilophila wadsworthia]|uniref:plasmid mobilization protein n=1 Tax=Bilophila wadsworthia TaxID=35833 RepID=UPI00241F8BAC|nr:plasmid mobilization relaxosome protein MobC [Bilophila wadsworthia]
MKRVKTARSAAVMLRVHPEERDLFRFNAGLRGMSMSDYIRQSCLGVRLRKTPEEKRRLRELARIGANLNQLARWANTYKRAAEAVEVLTALAGIERRIRDFALSATEDEAEDEPC